MVAGSYCHYIVITAPAYIIHTRHSRPRITVSWPSVPLHYLLIKPINSHGTQPKSSQQSECRRCRHWKKLGLKWLKMAWNGIIHFFFDGFPNYYHFYEQKNIIQYIFLETQSKCIILCGHTVMSGSSTIVNRLKCSFSESCHPLPN